MSANEIVYAVLRYNSNNGYNDVEEVISIHANEASAFDAISLKMKTMFLEFFEALNTISVIDFQLDCLKEFKFIKNQYDHFKNANNVGDINSVITVVYYRVLERSRNNERFSAKTNKIIEGFLDKLCAYEHGSETYLPWYFEIREFRLGEIHGINHECEPKLKKTIEELEFKIPKTERKVLI